eukprot:5503105-Lingulodinium_polyedra.AAC.1
MATAARSGSFAEQWLPGRPSQPMACSGPPLPLGASVSGARCQAMSGPQACWGPGFARFPGTGPRH